MAASAVRRWLFGLQARPGTFEKTKKRPRARLALERLEGREVPATSIPLNGLTWTELGPRPLLNGESPGRLNATGRFDSVSQPLAAPGNPLPLSTNLYAASAVGGIWTSSNNGQTWTSRTDKLTATNPVNSATLIRAVQRSADPSQDTVYAASSSAGSGFFYFSTDSGATFTQMGTAAFTGRQINEFIVLPGATQAQDLIYAAVQSLDGGNSPSGIYRSTDGGVNWVNIAGNFPANPVPQQGFPFAQASKLAFSDVDVDPTNLNVVYASVNADSAVQSAVGVYRVTNALAADGKATIPGEWALRLGGSAAFSGTLPGRLQTSVSPVLPSTIFVSVSSGSILGVYRSTDTGINWTPLLSDTFLPGIGKVPDYGIAQGAALGNTYSRILVDPSSPLNPNQQIIYAAGAGDTDAQVVISRDSGNTWQNLAVNTGTGIGPYIGVRDMVFDQLGRINIATEGGLYRLNGFDLGNQPIWSAMNGTAGPGALNTTQVNVLGQGLHPFDGNQVLINQGPFHSAARFNDTGGPASFGWQTIDSRTEPWFHINPVPLPHASEQWGNATVLYDFNNPNTILRVAAGGVRISRDGGATWDFANVPFSAPGAFVANPSNSRQYFSANPQDDVYLYDSFSDATDTLENILGFRLPSLDFSPAGQNPGTVTAIGVSRQSNLIYVATTAGIYDSDIQTQADPPPPPPPAPTSRLYVIGPNGIANAMGQLQFDWIELSLPVEVSGDTTGAIPPDRITQIIVDPNNPLNVFFTTQTGGGVYNMRSPVIDWAPPPDPPPDPITLLGPDPRAAIANITWQRLNPAGAGNITPLTLNKASTGANVITLDPNIGTNPNDDILYLGTNYSVYRLDNPANAKAGSITWQRVGGDELPNNAVRDLDINTSTGILSVGLNGRGVWQFQIRNLVAGRVFTDVDGDGLVPPIAGETLDTPLAGVVVTLRDTVSNSVVATTTSDAAGRYQFISVPAGKYTVAAVPAPGIQVTTAGVPEFTVGLDPATVVLSEGAGGPGFQIISQLNVGLYRVGSISGIKFDDANQNAARDAGEVGLPGFTIYIDTNNNSKLDGSELSIVTDGNGVYSFTNLGPASLNGAPNPAFQGNPGAPVPTYTLREVPVNGWVQTLPDPNVNGGAATVQVISGANPAGINFGNFQPGSIRGKAFFDINANGVLELGEPGLPGRRVFIDTNGNNTFEPGEPSVLTDVDGFYAFTNLANGTYVIRQQAVAGFVQTTPNPAAITLTGVNSVTGVVFGSFRPSTNRWDPVGPAPQLGGQGIGNPNVSGRVNDMAVGKSPTGGPDRYFIATDGGGVWRSLDAGVNWRPLTDNLPNLSVNQATSNFSSIAVAPSNVNVVYAGGAQGILRSTDGGETWLLSQGPGFAFAGSTISRIEVDRTNANIVVAAVTGFFDSGIFLSLDGGDTWTDTTEFDPLFSNGEQWTDVQVDPNNPNVVFAAVGNFGGSPSNGIYRTVNALAPLPTWTLMIGGSAFLPGSLPGNIKLAMAPSQPSTMYAALARAIDPFTGDSQYLGTYKTTDGGVNWIRLINAPDFMGTQGNYNVAIEVSPNNPSIAYAGGLGTAPNFSTNLVISTNDGGTSWKSAVVGGGADANLGPHVDIHGMAFDTSNRLLVGSDGGMFRLNNAVLPAPNFAPPFGGVVPNWVQLNGGPGNPNALNTIQFVGIATHPRDAKRAIGGSQDNGVAQYLNNPAWLTRLGGDAGETVWDFDQPNNIYRIAPIKSVGANNYIAKSIDGGVTWADATNGITGQTFQNTLFYPPLIMDPGNSQRLFTGTDVVWATDNGGIEWKNETKFSPAVDTPIPTTPFSGQQPPVPITTLAVGRSASQFLYISQGGRMLRIFLRAPIPNPPTTEDWIDVTPPGASDVTDILVDPTNPNTVYAVAPSAGGQVWRSTNQGGAWTLVDGSGVGQLPGLGIGAIGLDTRGSTNPSDDILYIGNSNGVWQTTNPTAANPIWERTGGATLPVVNVTDLDVNPTTGLLSAGTYGRGLWHTRIRGQISGRVFTDTNGNGVLDIGEIGRPGVTVRLLDATPGGSNGAELATTITDAQGFYAFSSLRAGNYRIAQALPANAVQTSAKVPDFFDVTEQTDIVPEFTGGLPPAGVVVEPTLNMGFFQLGTIGGVKFDDVNQNSTRDSGEFALPGFTIFVDRNNNGIFDLDERFVDLNGNSVQDAGEPDTFAVTDANGIYQLTSIFPSMVFGLPGPMPIPYRIREVQQPGFIQTTANPNITPLSGLNLTNVNFGNFRPGSIRGQVFFDLNNDGVLQPGEPGQANWQVYIDLNRNDTFEPGEPSVGTDAAGFFSFNNLPPGSYRVRQVLQPGFGLTTPNPADAVLNGSNSVSGILFGLFQVFNPWIEIGPRPIINGQSPGQPTATGRFDEVAITPSQTPGGADVYYAASQDGGIWRSTNAGQSWNVRSDVLPFTTTTAIAAFGRAGGDTVYAATQTGVYKSLDGANTFNLLGTGFFLGGTVSAMAAVRNAATPNNPQTDILFVTVPGVGIFRSTDGAQTWTDISTGFPFNPRGLLFTDVDIEPGNPNVVYVSVGSPAGGPTNGIYRVDNALTAGPVVPGQWTLRIGGSQFVPGSTPGRIELSISPNAPSVLFASVAERAAPLSGISRLLGVFRSTDAGINWTGLFNPEVIPSGNVPNYLNNRGNFNNTIIVSPFSGTDPTRQILFAGGYGDAANNVVFSLDSGNTWQDIAQGANGVGPYVGVHGMTFDAVGRLIVATQGGIFRLNGIFPSINWQPLNGNPGLGALNSLAIPTGGYASHPTDPYQGFANGGIDHSVVQHNGRLPAGYGWRTLDAPTTAPFHTQVLGRDGTGVVFYNFDNPNILFRVTTSNGGNDTQWLRRSIDGGATWQGISVGVPGQFANPYVYETLIDPGNSEHLFIGTDQMTVSNDGGNTWGTILRTSVTSTTPIPGLPTTGQSPPIPITAMGVGRTSGNVRPRLYAASAAGDLRTISLPDAAPPAQPATTEDWIAMNQPGGTVVKILVDPNNDLNIYVLTEGGLVLNGVFNPLTGTTFWTQLNDPNNGTSPEEIGSPGTNAIVLDPRNATDATDDALYLGTNSGVFKLVSPGGLFNQGPFFWSKVGTGLPNLPITALDLNATTGLLSAGTDGRGVWQVQIRALIQGVKYDDTNGNGTRDAGEPPVPGVVIQIVDATTGGVIATTTTDAQGIYEFRSLRAGSYTVREITPAGTILVSEAVPTLTLNETDAAVATYNGPLPVPTSITVIPQLALGNFRLAIISGFKFEDRDADGVRDAGEPGLGGFTIFFDRNLNGALDWTDTNANGVWDPGEGERWTVTAGDGSYAFTGLVPRDYPVREIQQLGFSQTSPNPAPIRPNSGQTVANVNFGNIRVALLAGALFNDVNGNGARDAGEFGLGGFTVQLVDRSNGQVIRTVQSDPDGSYAFRSLVPGNYEIRQALPAGWIQTFPVSANGQALTYQRVVGPTDQIGNLDFGNFRLFNISGVKFEDLNGNGQRDNGEPGAAGFTFTVRNLSTGVTANAVSGPTGAYTVPNLGPGTYSITEVPRAGWVQTTANPADFQALSGADLVNVDFGNFKLITVTGTIFGDVNQNGVRDGNEPALAGFTVLLDRNNDGTVDAQAVSDASGVYTFNSVGPGVYGLRQQPRRGWRLTSPSSGAYVFQAVSSQSITGRDFGNVNQGIYALGADSGGGPMVSIRSLTNNQQIAQFLAYTPAFRGGVRVATGFFDGSANAQLVTAPGPGGGPHVRVFNPLTGQEVYGFFAYAGGFSGGVTVAAGDVNGDGFDDIITGPGPGGGPHVRVWSGQTRQELFGFFAYDANFPGGVRVAAGDVDGDGKADIITGAGPGGGPHVRVFSGATGQVIREFFAYAPTFAGGVYVSAGDFNGDGKADIVTGPGAGGGPHVRVFSGANLGELGAVFPYEPNFLGGVHVFALDTTFDNRADLIVGPGPGRQPLVKTLQLNGTSFTQLNSYLGFDPSFLGGVWVG